MQNKLKEKFPDGVFRTEEFCGGEMALVSSSAWGEVCEFLKREMGFATLMDIICADGKGLKRDGGRFEVTAHLRNFETNRRVFVKARVEEVEPKLNSLTKIFKAANWFEREAFDMFGVIFSGHPNLKRLLCHSEFEGHPLRKDYCISNRGTIPVPDVLVDEIEDGVAESRVTLARRSFSGGIHESRMFLNLGPSHPAMHGCFRVILQLDGEKIARAAPELGYLHRGFEKEAESHLWHAIMPYAERLNYVSPMMNSMGYCMAVEKLVGLEIPMRAKWIRMLCAEVSRIIDHLVCVGVNLTDLGLLTGFWYFFNVRELFTDWIEKTSGARLTANYMRIGGMAHDIPSDTEKMLSNCTLKLRSAIKDVTTMIRGNRIFLERTKDVGAISEEEAKEYGFTGPCLRATGCGYDVRKAHPYYFYDDVNWDVPVGVVGDTYDRIFVRIEEMKQSASLIEQILKKIQPGPVMAHRFDLVIPQASDSYNTIEWMMSLFKLVTDGMKPPAGEIYSCTEAANGELGFFIISDGGPKPYRAKVRPPCFAIYQAFPRLVEGHMIADAVAILGSLNIIAGELDR